MLDIAETRRSGAESLAVWRTLGDHRHTAVTLAHMAQAEATFGEPDRALALLEESRALSDDPRHAADLEHPPILISGMVTKATGDLEGAKVLFEQALALGRADGDIHTTLASLRHLGTLAHQRGEVDVARHLIAESLGLARELGDYSCIGNGLAGLTLVAIDVEQAGRAARLLAVLGRLHEKRGFPSITMFSAGASIAAVRTRLGEEPFAAAWAAGRAMSLEQAIEYALDESVH